MAVGTSLRCSPLRASSLTRSVADQPPHVCLNFVHDFGDYYARFMAMLLLYEARRAHQRSRVPSRCVPVTQEE